ncbi:origin recognition complex subunit 3 N-terminus-domain-containing protein [Gigaspora rosea]|uniref:Origin recognition complex subunit 3 n=1 Tax=Gigaspora rosea TaxID=44941 RepID=A0A397TV85_9GLOM|nr:origin recognition complex subunit 3 N-terminus-domain-containing protein [Gigaspora rosea]
MSDLTKGSAFFLPKKPGERVPFEPLLEGQESSNATHTRYDDYIKAIQYLEKKIENFLLTVNESAISDLCNFVKNTYNKGENSILNPPNRFYALPTALVFTGIDKEENTRFFKCVSQKLQQNNFNHIVFLNSMDCTDMKRIEKQHFKHILGLKSLSKLIIIIQDFECFIPEVLENFIYLCSHYQDRIPIVLMLGITTCIRGIDPLHENYSYSVVRLLKPEAFYLQTQKARCDDLVSQCLIEDAKCMKVGEKTYEFLLDMFIGKKFSLSLFVSSLKYALMHYFYINPLSILTTIEPEAIHSRLDLLNENHVEMIRMQISFREYVESKLHQPAEARQLLCDDYYVKSLLPTFCQNMAIYHQRFAIALEFIIFLQEFLQECLNYDVKKLKSKYELYSIALKKPGLGENEYIQILLDDLIKIDPKKIGELLQIFVSILKTMLDNVENIKQEYEDFYQFLVRSKEIENDLTRPSASTRSAATKIKNKESTILQKIEKIGDDYKQLVIDVVNYLEVFFDENLRHYSTNTLFELFYYQEDISILECAFVPKIRSAIHAALGLSTEYINCNCCMVESDDESNEKDDNDWDSREQILSTHNDTSILYKLHLQCGKLINVRDWLDSFENVISKENLENRKLNEKEIVARFIKGFEELKLIGIIGSSSRKTDHFKRLSWGKL